MSYPGGPASGAYQINQINIGALQDNFSLPSSSLTLTDGANKEYAVWPRDSEGYASDVWLDGTYTNGDAKHLYWGVSEFYSGSTITELTGEGASLDPITKTFTIRDANVPVTRDASGTPVWACWFLVFTNENDDVIEVYNPTEAEGKIRWAVGVNILMIGQSNMVQFTDVQVTGVPDVTQPVGQFNTSWSLPVGDGAISLGNEIFSTGLPVGIMAAGIGATAMTAKADQAAGVIGWWMDYTDPKGPMNGYCKQKVDSMFNIPSDIFSNGSSNPPRVEGVVIWQGEAEAIKTSSTGVSADAMNGAAEYYGYLHSVLDHYRTTFKSWNGPPPCSVCLLARDQSVFYVNALQTVVGYQGGMCYDAVRDAALQYCADSDFAYPVFTADGALQDHIHVDGVSMTAIAKRVAGGLRHYWAGPDNGWESVITDTSVGTSGPYLSYAYQSAASTVRIKVIQDTGTSLIVPADAANLFVVFCGENSSDDMISVTNVSWDGGAGELVLTLNREIITPLFEVEYAGHADLDTSDFITDDEGLYLQHSFGAFAQKGELKDLDNQLSKQRHQAGKICGSRYLPGSLAGPANTHGLVQVAIAGTAGNTAVFTALDPGILEGMKFVVYRWTSDDNSTFIGTGIVQSRSGNTLTLVKSITGITTGDSFTFDWADTSIAGLTTGYIPFVHHESGSSMIGVGIRGHSSAPAPTVMNTKRGD